MPWRDALRTGLAALAQKTAGVRVPVDVQLLLTDRGPRVPWSCAARTARPEMSTQEVEGVLHELARFGTARVAFAGGDPLVRTDLGHLSRVAADAGLRVVVETGGEAYPEHAQILAESARVLFHVEGREATHDGLRGAGSYRAVVSAMELAVARAQPFAIAFELTGPALGDVDDVLDLAASLGTRVYVTLPSVSRLYDEAELARFQATPDAWHRALVRLLAGLDAGRPVATRREALARLLTWPDLSQPFSETPSTAPCLAGRLYCTIDVDGHLYPCTLLTGATSSYDVREVGALQAFWNVGRAPCRSCTSTALFEENALLDLHVGSLLAQALRDHPPRRG